MEGFVDHDDGGGAATGEAFDELDGDFAVGGDLVEFDAEFLFEGVANFVGAFERAGKGAADFDVAASDGVAFEHGVEGDDFVDVDELEFESGSDPFDGFVGNVADVFLDEVQERERGAALDRIVRDDFGDAFECGRFEIHG